MKAIPLGKRLRCERERVRLGSEAKGFFLLEPFRRKSPKTLSEWYEVLLATLKGCSFSVLTPDSYKAEINV
jgi:hypothetical protein